MKNASFHRMLSVTIAQAFITFVFPIALSVDLRLREIQLRVLLLELLQHLLLIELVAGG